MGDGNAIDRWYSAFDLAGMAGMPLTHSATMRKAKREGWKTRTRKGQGGGVEYSFSDLPLPTRTALLLREQNQLSASGMAPVAQAAISPRHTEDSLESALEHYENASRRLKDMAAERLRAVVSIDALQAQGVELMRARELVSEQLKRDGAKGSSTANLARWQSAVQDAPRSAWLSLLLPRYGGSTREAPCDPRALDWYKSFWLSRRQPTHADAYSRLKEIAKVEGWVIPSSKTLIRRMDDVDILTQTLLRQGPEAAARRLPVQQRDRSVFAAGEAVNGDGLKFDMLWVKFDDGEILNTATAWFWQDLRSNKMLAFRLGKTENTDLFRLATYDLTAICAPAHVWVDNTRVAANKLMTAGASGRHRFKSEPEDGLGLLLMLGMEPHFTNPDKEMGNPGAKPVERAFGIGGIHKDVVTNPKLQNRGFSKATAITEHELREVIAFEVMRYNAKTERRTQSCRGVLSFDQAWEQGMTERPPRVLSEKQRRMLLMCREVVRADSKTGTVWLKAGRSQYDRNRYWCRELGRAAGTKMVAHFDPENLSAGIHLYSLDGRYLFAADHQPGRAYNDQDASREDMKFRARLIKLNKKAAAETVRIDAHERAKLYANATGQSEPVEPKKRSARGNVVAGNFQTVIDPMGAAARAAEAAAAEAADLKRAEWMTNRLKKMNENAL